MLSSQLTSSTITAIVLQSPLHWAVDNPCKTCYPFWVHQWTGSCALVGKVHLIVCASTWASKRNKKHIYFLLLSICWLNKLSLKIRSSHILLLYHDLSFYMLWDTMANNPMDSSRHCWGSTTHTWQDGLFGGKRTIPVIVGGGGSAIPDMSPESSL